MSAIERVKAHFSALGRRRIEIPEWGEEGQGPMVAYATPLTLAESQKYKNVSAKEGEVAGLAHLVVMKLQDEQGKPLFTLDDKHALRTSADSGVLSRVVVEIMAGPTADDLEKK